MDTLQIDSGIKRVSITRDGIEVPDTIEFNPSDVRWAERFQTMKREVLKSIEDMRKKAEVLSKLSEDATEEDQTEIEKQEIELRDVCCTFMREKIDILFGLGTSQKAFGDLHSEYAIASFLENITPYIQLAREKKYAKYIPPATSVKRKKHAVMK